MPAVRMPLIQSAMALRTVSIQQRNAFDAIPKDMEEAAMVDGCNSLQSLIKILVPVVMWATNGLLPERTYLLDMDPAQSHARLQHAEDRMDKKIILKKL